MQYIEKRAIILYFFIALVVFILVEMFKFSPALDITRYYESAITGAKYYNDILLYTRQIFEDNYDFVYMLSLYLAQKIGAPLNLITTIYILVYYYSICEIVKYSISIKRLPNSLLFFILLCVPFIWLLSISRTTAAIAFLYCSILNFYKGNKNIAVIYTLLSILSHISMLFFVSLFACIYVMRSLIFKIHINRKILFLLLVFSFVFSRYMFLGFEMVVSATSGRYSEYAMFEHTSAIFSPVIGYGDKIPMVFTYFYSIYLIFKVKNRDFFYYSLLILVLLLTMTIDTSLFFTNRLVMVMPLFIGMNVCSLLNSDFTKKRELSIISIGGMITVLLHFWSYRLEFAL